MPHLGFGPADPRPRLPEEEPSCDPFDPDYNPGDPRCAGFNPFTDTRFDPFPGCGFGEAEGPDGLCYSCSELGMVENEAGECVVHPSDTTFVIDVSDCEQRGGKVVDGRCVLPETDIGPVLTGPVPKAPPRSRSGAPSRVPLPRRLPGRSRASKPCPEGEKRDPETGECITTFEGEGTACPDDKVLVNGVCVDPSTPTDKIPRPPPRSRVRGTPKPPDDPVPPRALCPDGTPVPLTGTCPKESDPKRPGIPSLSLSGLVAPGRGSGLSFLSPINVGASPGGTLFPAQQAVPEVPGTLMQFLASLVQR